MCRSSKGGFLSGNDESMTAVNGELSAAEVRRLSVLASYGVLDTPPELPFDEIVRLAATACGAPMAAVSFVDSTRQWFKAEAGLGRSETPREDSFCAHAFGEVDGVLVVQDATTDPRFVKNSLVTGEPGIRAYAGVALKGDGDQPLGALCVLDSVARSFSETEVTRLQKLAKQVEALLELRRVAGAWKMRADDRSFALAFRRAPVAMNLVGPDGRFISVNEAMARLVGRTVEDLLGTEVREVINADDQLAEARVMTRLAAGELESASREGSVVTDGGLMTPVRATTSAVLDPSGELLFFMTSLEDLTERRAAEDALALTHSATEAIMGTDAEGRITFWNVGAANMFGHRAGEAIGQSITLIMPQRFHDAHRAGLARLVAGDAPKLIGETVELTGVRHTGEEFPIELTLARWVSRGKVNYSGLVRDITDRQRLQQQLEHRANHDMLTGLWSRQRFYDEVADTLVEGRSATVLLAGLDRFRRINDSLGYQGGDHVLIQVAERLTAAVQPLFLARMGGDQFACLVPGSLDRARRVAEDLLGVFDRAVEVDGLPVHLDATVGMANVRPQQVPRTAIREAETAMYLAKRRGRATEVFDDQVRIAALHRLEIESDLRQALIGGDLELHYQPEIDVRTGRVSSVEALARWTHRGEGVPPGEFIPVAEETGLIHPLGRWVLDRSLADLPALRCRYGNPSLSVAVNVSPIQLGDPAFAEHVSEILVRHRVCAGDLIVEVTESTVMGDAATATGHLEVLGELGVRIAIDDFGTGYSSLALLHQMPVSILKIDRSFIDPLPDEGAALVSTVVGLARNLGLSTVAEGIETRRQLDAVRDHGIDTAQGFFLARPAPLASPLSPGGGPALPKVERR